MFDRSELKSFSKSEMHDTLKLDSYLNSYTSLADVSRHLGLRGQQVAKVRELLARG